MYIYTHTHTYIYMYIYTHTHTYIYMYIYTHTHTYIYMYIYTHTHTYIYMYIYIHTHVYICIYTHMYIHTHTHTHTYIYIHIHTHTVEPMLSKNMKGNLNSTIKITDDSQVKNKSNFFPDKNNNNELSTFFEKLWDINLREKLHKTTYHRNKDKLWKYTRKQNIIIKEMDNESVVVILEKKNPRNTKKWI